MNAQTRSLIAATALALAGSSAFATDATAGQDAGVPVMSRSAVTAEALRARQTGEIAHTATPYAQVDAALAASHRGVTLAASGPARDARQTPATAQRQPRAGE